MDESNLYYKTISKELKSWEKQMMKRPRLTNRASKALQVRIQKLVPKKAQDIITASVKGMVNTVMTGSSLLTKTETASNPTLAESDYLVEQKYALYYKTAIAQGVGFGLGGILINLADLPALMTIKVKFLFDCAKLYGYDVNLESERMFMMYVFQLAFCSDQRRLDVFPIIKNWDKQADSITIDWERLQMEYRDYLDIAKLLQLLPVVGAIAGGAANHSLMNKLKITAVNCYRYRLLEQEKACARL